MKGLICSSFCFTIEDGLFLRLPPGHLCQDRSEGLLTRPSTREIGPHPPRIYFHLAFYYQHCFGEFHPYMWYFVDAAFYVVFHEVGLEELYRHLSHYRLAEVDKSSTLLPIRSLMKLLLDNRQELIPTLGMMLILHDFSQAVACCFFYVFITPGNKVYEQGHDQLMDLRNVE